MYDVRYDAMHQQAGPLRLTSIIMRYAILATTNSAELVESATIGLSSASASPTTTTKTKERHSNTQYTPRRFEGWQY